VADDVLPHPGAVVVEFTPGAIANVVQAEVLGIGMFLVKQCRCQPCFIGY